MLRFVALFVTAAVLTATCHIRTLERRNKFPPEEDILYLPKISALKAMSLGHHELVATLIFIRSLVYYGGEIGSKDAKFRWLDNYLESIVSLDPRFELPYRWAGTVSIYNGKPITNDMVRRASYYLKKGVEHFPKSWQLHWMIGCNYMFELRTDDPKQKEEWVRIGADWIRQAALLGGAPPWAALLAAQIMRKEGQTEASIRYLEEIYLTTSEEKTKEEIRNRLLTLKSKVALEGLERNAREFTDAWQRTLPYAHPDLFVILGEQPVRRLDPEWLGRDQLLLDAQRSEDEMRRDLAQDRR